MKLIREEIEDVQCLVEETTPGKKNYHIQGIFLQGDRQNRNGRVYPSEVLQKEVDRYTKNYISKNRAFGELGHPDTPSINLDRASHIIKDLKRDGSNFVGKAKILDTPMGRIVKNLIDEGCTIGVSSRGVGSLKPHNGYQLVQDDFMLSTAADIVADPSAPDAFVAGIMEGKEWIMDNGLWKEVDIEKAKKSLQEASRRDYEDMKLRVFEKFIHKLAKS